MPPTQHTCRVLCQKVCCATAWLLLWLAATWGCRPASSEVVVYCALDTEFSRPILESFSQETGIAVRPKFDVESTKTVGLTQQLLAEGQNPRCDLFWNNEILNTLRLERAGVLTAHIPPQAAHFPAEFRSPQGLWHGFAARARVLLLNHDRLRDVPRDQWPDSIHDLADPRWRGDCGLAKPLFGTTATHATCLFAVWGPEAAEKYFQQLKQNDVRILAGNKQVALEVASGAISFGLTDTDDAIIELEQGAPVTIVYPDQQPDELGTLFIPNTIALLRGSPHPAEGARLADYLLTRNVEERLMAGPSAQIPLHDEAAASDRVSSPRQVRAMQVDFRKALDSWDTAANFLKEEFTGP